jgi:hypothetical protein
VTVGPDVRNCIVAADRHYKLTVRQGNDMICAVADGKLLVLPIQEADRIKEIARQNALFIGSHS